MDVKFLFILKVNLTKTSCLSNPKRCKILLQWLVGRRFILQALKKEALHIQSNENVQRSELENLNGQMFKQQIQKD